MKKFVLIDLWGTWKDNKGRAVIDCTVKGYKVIAESNDCNELKLPDNEYRRPDGTWHTYRVEKRANAKRMGLA